MMELNLLLFGVTKDIVGGNETRIKIEGATIGELRVELVRQYPEISRLNSLMIAVNNEYANDDLVLKVEDEIALIPPVSGG